MPGRGQAAAHVLRLDPQQLGAALGGDEALAAFKQVVSQTPGMDPMDPCGGHSVSVASLLKLSRECASQIVTGGVPAMHSKAGSGFASAIPEAADGAGN